MQSSTKKTKRPNPFISTLRGLARVVWPDNCPVCDRPLNRGESPVCLHCLADMPRIKTDRSMPYVGAPDNSIPVLSWFVYDHNHPSHRLIHDIKYHDRRRMARKLGREFAMQKELTEHQFDCILPVPLHWTKFVSRGYNQTVEIALGIRDVTGIPVSRNLFAKKPHDTQTHRDRSHRMDNVRDIFALRRPAELDGRNIAILDDVITTGATVFSALDTVLKECTPASVTFLSLARTRQL